jgi:hypothetical protein
MRGTTVDTQRLEAVVRADALINVTGGLALMLAGGWLAPYVGLASGWPLRVAGVLLVVYGLENHLVARRPTASGWTGLIAVDVGFAAAMLVLAITDPTGAVSWMRWALVAVGLASLTFGMIKLAGRRLLREPLCDGASDDSPRLIGRLG